MATKMYNGVLISSYGVVSSPSTVLPDKSQQSQQSQSCRSNFTVVFVTTPLTDPRLRSENRFRCNRLNQLRFLFRVEVFVLPIEYIL